MGNGEERESRFPDGHKSGAGNSSPGSGMEAGAQAPAAFHCLPWGKEPAAQVEWFGLEPAIQYGVHRDAGP